MIGLVHLYSVILRAVDASDSEVWYNHRNYHGKIHDINKPLLRNCRFLHVLVTSNFAQVLAQSCIVYPWAL